MNALAADEGVDPETACKIEVKVTAYFSVIDGRTEYKKGRTLCWTVDSEEYAIVELVSDVQAYYRWADYQDVEFWYVGEGDQSVKLCNDAELLSLLRASRTVRFDMKIVGEQHGMDTKVVLFNGLDEQIVGVDDLDEQVNELLKEPLFGETVAGPGRVEEEETEYYMIEGVDPDGDEPAGVDEEWRYFKKMNKKVAEEKASEKEQEKASEKAPEIEVVPSQPDYDPDSVPSDEAVLVASAYVPITTYDRDNPKIV
ncbi:unnamed protein product [Urochloa decumbens]|uniref:Uncharacterized protein n=1 Tax=Urochloa decumbens TaxID=240449 RepID=A0ABC9BLF6_9POAL